MKAMPKSLLVVSAIIAAMTLPACYQVGDAVKGAVQDIQTTTVAASEEGKAMTPSAAMLADYDWVLIDAQRQDAPLESFSQIVMTKSARLSFFDNRLSLTAGCNQMGGAYSMSGSEMSVGAMMSTRKACGELNATESKLAAMMDGSKLSVQLDKHAGTAVLQQSKGASVLTWQGKLTHKARYGEPARLFWEIDPETVSCVDSNGKDGQCLKVRNVNYDEKGIKVGSGAWRTFHGEIEGFRHDPSLRQIIRLNAYSPADKSAPIYVFDMAVETELLK